ncbi:MAG TPA: NADH-quinone oxidoreductase subunit C [Actinomycetota bacterium]|nr:NADH-quinone oxidoreductase subunit C [Actinomycetota bacterium]
MDLDQLAERLRERFEDVVAARGEATVTVGPDALLGALRMLRDEPELSFGFLSDVSATDWPGRVPRVWLAYHLYSFEHNHRVRAKVGLPEDRLLAPSVTSVFPAADWLEREVYDMYGVEFEGHPDLRRILMPEDWVGYPLRKDHPLGGVATQYKGAFVPPPDQRGL